MRIVEDIKFSPIKSADGVITGYLSTTTVEVEGEAFTASRFMPAEEHDAMYPVLRDFIHNTLKSDIVVQLRKKLFQGVPR
jgi:hypothetical protein